MFWVVVVVVLLLLPRSCKSLPLRFFWFQLGGRGRAGRGKGRQNKSLGKQGGQAMTGESGEGEKVSF